MGIEIDTILLYCYASVNTRGDSSSGIERGRGILVILKFPFRSGFGIARRFCGLIW